MGLSIINRVNNLYSIVIFLNDALNNFYSLIYSDFSKSDTHPLCVYIHNIEIFVNGCNLLSPSHGKYIGRLVCPVIV